MASQLSIFNLLSLVAVFVMFFAVPALLFISLRIMKSELREDLERERRAKNQCIGCGYDLRASKTICSECGLAIADQSDVGVMVRS